MWQAGCLKTYVEQAQSVYGTAAERQLNSFRKADAGQYPFARGFCALLCPHDVDGLFD